MRLRPVVCVFLVLTALSVRAADQIRIEQGRVHVSITASPQKYTLTAKVRTSWQLRNPTNAVDDTRRVFPVAAPQHWNHAQGPQPWCRVLVNDQPVPAETQVLIDPRSRTRSWPDEKQRIEWSKRINGWFAEDAELQALVARYRELNESRRDINTVTEEFQKRAKAHLIHDRDLDYTVVYVATDNPYFGHLVKLMPEIDPSLRIDGKFQRWQYVSILDEYDAEIYRPYEDEWRAAFFKWIDAKPELAELLPKLREVWLANQQAQKLLNGPLVKHLHDVNGLDLQTSQLMTSFIERGGNTPPTALVRSLFPDIAEQLDQAASKESELLRKWGFDESALSPITGKLIPARDMPPVNYRDLWRDPTVLAELGRPIPPSPPHGRNRVDSSVPVLVSFDAPVAPNETTTVAIEHSVELMPLMSPMHSAFRMGGQNAFASVFPSPRDVEVTVTCSPGIQPIIAPAPHTVSVSKDGTRRFDLSLDGDSSMLHLVPVNIVKDSNSWLGRFGQDRHVVADLKALIDRTSNPTVRPMLQAALYPILLQSGDPWDAQQLARQIAREHSDFATIVEAVQKATYGSRKALEMYDWVVAKGAAPQLVTEEDLNRFKRRSGNDQHVLSPNALAALADRVAPLDVDKLNILERMGRLFILCQAGNDTANHLAELLELAGANPKLAIESLKLIQFLTIEDKSSALPFVLKQIDPQLRDKARAGKITTSSFEWIRQNGAYYAMSTFRSPKAATGLVEFIQSTDDSLLVQGATQALSHMTLPDHFEELVGIADRVAGASESAFIQYLDLLLRSAPDPEQALPVLDEFREKYPKLARRVMRALGRAGHKQELNRALEVYQSSKDIEGQVQSSISVIQDLAKPEHIAALTYRKGLPEWMNERLVSIVRFKGGDESHYPFVEAYYQEHVRGNSKHNHLTCVAAFEQIGDPRAIPLLREVFQSTERKRDAAQAIGHLTLRRAIRRERVVYPFDAALQRVTTPGQPDDVLQKAWQTLLASPDEAFQRAMRYGALRSAIDDADSIWSESDRQRVAFISRFGNVAARHLLKASQGCSLPQRYRFAALLQLVLPETRAIVQQDAADDEIDPDRRLTARLALKLSEAD